MTPEQRGVLHTTLVAAEGLVLKPYRDTVGKLTIGVGRNLDDRGISKATALQMLDEDLDGTEADLDRVLPWWRHVNEVRQRVLLEMAFNMGITTLAGFHQTLEALKDGEYERAAEEMLHSVWAWQVKGRADRLARMMRIGKDPMP